ncbi:hypothetical protein F1C15_11915 [Frigoribacterium sp. NBH87]|uniref:hypothetical protein n=1 Tax=Frigoribacterium sp. NBH87 TaxID=2596916 RepID=UPI0016288BD0|nr:hypothetical protein [Frigoribacterium sp. NBH87]QNE44423.1 hypothetical protein F1C15_11915 [Frigoribacterium sp. NBH87]
MDLDNLSHVDLRRLGLLGRAVAIVDSGEAQATPGMLAENRSDADERRAVTADAMALSDEGLLRLDERFNGAWLARPTVSGRDTWSEYERRRDDPRERRRRLRNDYLRWIHEAGRQGGPPNGDSFIDSGASYLGALFTLEELHEAGVWLKRQGFIDGGGAWGRSSPLRPFLTAKGEDYVDRERDVHAEPPQGNESTSYTFNGQTQFASGSSHFTQTQNMGDVGARAGEIAAALRQLSLLSTGIEHEELSAAASQLEEEVAGAARPQRLRAIAEAAQQILVSGAGGALGSIVSSQVTDFIDSLPI